MQKEIDPKVFYILIGILVIGFAVFFVKATGGATVPETEIKAPAPPGGFPAGSPRGPGGSQAPPSIPAPE